MSRRCMITDNATDEKCLGHPPVDDDWYPAICDGHLEAIFGRLIQAKAEALAGQLLTERLMSRPGRRDRGQRPATPKLRPGQHLTEQDEATLAFLTGRAA